MWWLDLPNNIRRLAETGRWLWVQVRKHPYLFGSLGSIVLSIFAGHLIMYLVFIQPARSAVSSFYGAIDNEQYEIAWEILDNDYQVRWDNGINEFKSGYGTTVKHTDIIISDSFSLRQLKDAIFTKCVELDIEYRVIDRFKKETFDDDIQDANQLCLELFLPTRYRQLMDGTLPGGESTVELTRIYEKRATLSRKRGEWRISSLQSRSMSFEYGTR